jgi:hypothetical protein
MDEGCMMSDFRRQEEAPTKVKPSTLVTDQVGLYAIRNIPKHHFIGCYPGEERFEEDMEDEDGTVRLFRIAKGL